MKKHRRKKLKKQPEETRLAVGATAPESSTSPARDERDFWMAEYGMIVEQFHKYYDIHIRAFGVYLGVTSLLFIMAIKEVPDQKAMLTCFGYFFSLAYAVVLCCSLYIINKLCLRRIRALTHLGHPEIEDDLHPAGRWSCYIYFVIILVVCGGWCYILQMPAQAAPQSPTEQASPPPATSPVPPATSPAPPPPPPTPPSAQPT